MRALTKVLVHATARAVHRGLALLAISAGVLSAGCATPMPPLPLRPPPVAWADTLPIPEPAERSPNRVLRTLMVNVPYDLSEDLHVSEGEALNRTHFDDAVSSAWWERRMGYEAITPEHLARGHLPSKGAPDTSGVFTVRSGKLDGATPGFVAEDSKGDVYILKMDPVNVPYLQSSAGVIANRLMWGAGYWVPDDYVTALDPARLTVAEDATVEVGGQERPMTMEDVEHLISKTWTLPDGRVRALASKFVPGKPKGPTLFSERRADDPNDHYVHQHRRELRALRIVAAWLNDTDRREGNTLDVYVKPGYLRHYQIDFAASLGSLTARPKHPKDDVERPADLIRALARFASLGVYREGWENAPQTIMHPALGFLKVTTFDPDEWKAAWTNPAFVAMTDADAYWGAKIVSSFTEEHIRAAVREGQLPEPWMVDQLTQALVIRRDKVMGRYFSSVSPIEDPKVEPAGAGAFALSFEDLGIERGIWRPEATRYRWTFSDEARGIESSGEGAARAGEQLLEVTWGTAERKAKAGGELAVLRVLAVRDRYYMDGRDPRAATIWLRWNESAGRYQVVGLEH
jgi:hypothetical protein